MLGMDSDHQNSDTRGSLLRNVHPMGLHQVCVLEERVEQDRRRHEEAQEYQPNLPNCNAESIHRKILVNTYVQHTRTPSTATCMYVPLQSAGTSSFVISAPH